VRTARRAATRLLLFALIGAAATVLVAWGCAAFSSVQRLHGTPAPAAGWPNWLAIPSSWPSPRNVYVRSAAGMSVRSLHFFDRYGETRMRTRRRFDVHVHDLGWPSLAMRYAIASASERPAVHISPLNGGLPVPARSAPWRRLPLRMIPTGFAVDTAFWGGAAVLVWSVPGFVRRGVRRRRGRCVRCGYELKGLAVCPECGHQRAPTVREGPSRRGRQERGGAP
jgi:hypothetical protein